MHERSIYLYLFFCLWLSYHTLHTLYQRSLIAIYRDATKTGAYHTFNEFNQWKIRERSSRRIKTRERQSSLPNRKVVGIPHNLQSRSQSLSLFGTHLEISWWRNTRRAQEEKLVVYSCRCWWARDLRETKYGVGFCLGLFHWAVFQSSLAIVRGGFRFSTFC